MLDTNVNDVLNAASKVVTGAWLDGYKDRKSLVAARVPSSFSDGSLD